MRQIPSNIDPSWTLFLDRDGVINEKPDNDYVKSWDEFQFKQGTLEALKSLSVLFGNVVIVTNQQGIGKGLMAEGDLKRIHTRMCSEITEVGGHIDHIEYCPHLATEGCICRKPRTGMALNARKLLPQIDFKKSVLIGDSDSDIAMGHRLGMFSIRISPQESLLDVLN